MEFVKLVEFNYQIINLNWKILAEFVVYCLSQNLKFASF